VPIFNDGKVSIFETGAIVQYIGEKSETLLPRDVNDRFRAIQWTYAALNSVEPSLMNVVLVDIFYANEDWAKQRRPGAADFARLKLKRVSDWLGEREWLEDRFTIGDLMMITVFRLLRHTEIVQEFPNLAAYLERGQNRPAFQRALSDQLAAFSEHQPQGEAA
jgi:glutathione S-transferase